MPDAGRYQEKRRYARFPIELPVNCLNIFDNSVFEGFTRDISAQGLALISRNRLSPQTFINIRLTMPDNQEKIFLQGKAVWVKDLGNDKFLMGIEITGHKIDSISLTLRSIQSLINRNTYH